MALLVYYSSATENTHYFVNRLQHRSVRLLKKMPIPEIREPFVLVVPTYAGAKGEGAVPKTVIQFLNDEKNRQWLKGVIAGGNRNFGWAYALAGKVVSQKCHVPWLYSFELRGTTDDVKLVRQGLEKLWKQISPEKLNR